MDSTSSKHYQIAFIISIIILILWIISFFLSTIKYCLYIYKIKKVEENNPFIDLSGIQNFSFVKAPSNEPEYNSQISNLGYTGELIFDCYKGICKYEPKSTSQIKECQNYKYCYTEKIEDKTYCNFFKYESSKQCRENYVAKCNACYKYYDYSYINCTCSNRSDTNYYSYLDSCYADNIIYNWKNLTYNRNNQTFSNFNYSNNAFPSNEKCPSNMHQCGILDEFGNKLCYPIENECPINYITLNSSDKNYSYNEYTIDGVKIYYTNKAIEDGKVLGGFYVDSDLMIKYNIGECQIIDTSKISDLLNSQKNKLYRNNLKFDPYKDENIDKKGKAYLKWCIPGVGKERNITLVKQLTKDYELNRTINKNIIDYTKRIKIIYFTTLPGYIIITITLTIASIVISRRNINGCKGAYIPFTLFCNIIVFLSGFTCFELFDMNKSELNRNIFNIIIGLGITIFLINTSLTIIFIIFFCYLCCYLNEKSFVDNLFKSNNNYKYLKDKNTTELQKKYDNDSEQNNYTPYDNCNQSSKDFSLTPGGIN